MKWIVFAVGLLTAVFGAWWSWDGYNIVQVERGWAKHIAGAVLFGAGLLTLAFAALMHKVQQLAGALTQTRQAPRAYAPPPAPPEIKTEDEEPAPVAPPASTSAAASAIPTGAAAAAVAASLPPETPAKEADDGMLAAVGAALAAEPQPNEPLRNEPPPNEPPRETQEESRPPLRPVAPFAPKLPEAREPFVFRPPPPLQRGGEATLDFSQPPSDQRPSYGRGFGEPTPPPPGRTSEASPEPAPERSSPETAIVDDVKDAPEVTVSPPPGEAPKLDQLFADLPPEPPKPAEEPPRRRSSFDWLSTSRRRAETPAIEPAPAPPEPEAIAAAGDEPTPVTAAAEAAEDASDRAPSAQSSEPAAPEAAPDIAEELVDAPVSADDSDARLVRRYESQGVKYSLYEDGSIRAESERGVFRFGSLAELRGFLEKGG